MINPMSVDASEPFVRPNNHGSINVTSETPTASDNMFKWLGRLATYLSQVPFIIT